MGLSKSSFMAYASQASVKKQESGEKTKQNKLESLTPQGTRKRTKLKVSEGKEINIRAGNK